MISFPVPFGRAGILYFVQSVSSPGELHQVQIGPSGKAAHCDCHAWKYRRTCRHATIAEDALLKDMARWALLNKDDFLSIEEVIEAFSKIA